MTQENKKTEVAVRQDKVVGVAAKQERGVGVSALIIAIVALLVALGAAAGAGLVIAGNGLDWFNQGGYFDGNTTQLESNTVEGVVTKVAPGVVSITTETQSTQRNWYGGTSTESAAGTGMIVTKDGYVLTNKHVVDGATKVTVITDAGDVYENVKVAATDPLNDVAFLKIDGVQDLPAVELGNSKTLKVGQPVMAIGNALGQYQNTVTQGVISGLGRSITAEDGNGESENLTDMIQTDASINPGNSGGPLVNAAGQVIGMNTAVSTSANGLGFAIPIGAVRGMLVTLTQSGTAAKAYLGVYYQAITPELATEKKLPVKKGAYVSRGDNQTAVIKGSPAEQAGVKDGDIITKVNDDEVGTAGSLSALLSEYMAGQTVKITVLRDGQTTELSVKLTAYEDASAQPKS
jgi:serine protease Do